MDEQYYALYLDDPVSPPYCSVDKLYVGTKTELDAAIQAMSAEHGYEDTVIAYNDYWQGNMGATHHVAYREMPILSPVQMGKSTRLELKETEWEHLNVWRCPYKMRAEGILVKQILLEYKQQYYRMMRAWFKNLCYQSPAGNWRRVEGGFWGHGCLLDVQHLPSGDVVLNNLLYMEQDRFGNRTDAESVMQELENVVFDCICGEIFADG